VDDRSIDFVSITHIAEDREHNIWAGTGNNGLFRFNPSKEFFTNIKPVSPATRQYTNGSPVAFMHDLDSSILVGVWQEGLFRYDKNFKEIPLDIKGFPGNKIPAIIKMSKSLDHHIIWMASHQGIYKYNQATRMCNFTSRVYY
jgi:ligand-binding sensor domain-containing protein